MSCSEFCAYKNGGCGKDGARSVIIRICMEPLHVWDFGCVDGFVVITCVLFCFVVEEGSWIFCDAILAFSIL